jgi:hypothetical protein
MNPILERGRTIEMGRDRKRLWRWSLPIVALVNEINRPENPIKPNKCHEVI